MLPLLAAGILSAAPAARESHVRVLENSTQEIVLQVDSERPCVERVSATPYSRISLANATPPAVEGAPDLPLYGGMIAIPANASYSISYQLGDPVTLSDVKPLPAGDACKSPLPSPQFYDGGVYPAEQVRASSAAWIRDYRVLPLEVCPFSWDAAQNALTHYGSIRISVSLSYPDAGGMPEPYPAPSAAFRRLYEARILNYSALRDPLSPPASPRVLIIHGDYSDATFIAKINEFAAWKRQKGFEVSIASTAIAGTSNTAIKSYIQALYDNPATRPDYIILIGDISGSFAVPTFYETDSGYDGPGDYPYTYLSGNDMLGDAFIGRMSAENLSQLITLFSKVYTYEKNVNTALPYSAWLNRFMIIGDPTPSGVSTVYTGHFIHTIAEQAHPEYEFIENYDEGFVSTINSGINQGVGFFVYRGYAGVSDWAPSSSLVNSYRLPHSVIITCGTGLYEGASLSEDFIRMGTESVPAGAATCIGMSTNHTHTLFNNALTAGIMSGVLTQRMRTMGEALLNGRLYLHDVYSAALPDRVKAHAHWCNLMGDPTLETWVGIPTALSITAPASIPAGTGILELEVADTAGAPLEGVCVTAYSPAQGMVAAKAFTGAGGAVMLELPSTLEGSILITASGHDIKPLQTSIAIDPAGSLVYHGHQVLDDGSGGSSGNADGIAGAGETITLNVSLRNSTASTLTGISASLNVTDPNITILQPSSLYPDMAAGSTASGSMPFLLHIGTGIAAHQDIRCGMDVMAGAQNYQLEFYITASNARLDVTGIVIADGDNAILDGGDLCGVGLHVTNSGMCGAENIQGELRSLDNAVTITDSLSWFGTIAAGAQTASTDGFQLRAKGWIVPGMQVPMRLRLFNFNGFEQVCLFSIPVGSVNQNTPLGPDAYGYMIYDDTDTAYPDCPVYDWLEIAPSLGGPGTELSQLTDAGAGSGEGESTSAHPLQVVDLPFTFSFYGEAYNQITVCVNGFIAMGVTEDADCRNVWLPGGQGACPMIAPFWDDLYLPNNAGVYQFHDTALHRYIIQYHNLRNKYDRTSLATFQVIFYDPLYHHSGLGDGIIKIQYREFHNVDAGGSGETPFHGNFCTIGIKDHTNTRGLTYSFNNAYAAAAAPLGNERAILITTVPAVQLTANLLVEDVILYDGNDCLLMPSETAELGIKLHNAGLADAAGISASLVCSSPYATMVQGVSEYPNIEGMATAVNRFPFVVSVADSCPDGTFLQLECQVVHSGGSTSFPISLLVRRPALTFSGFIINDAASNGNGLLEPGENALLLLNFRNPTLVPAAGLAAALSTTDTHINLLDNTCAIAGIPPLATVQAALGVHLAESAPAGIYATLNLAYSISGGPPQNAQINLRFGSGGLYSNFETDNGSFASTPTANAWQWGAPQSVGAHSGSKVWGTLLDQQYPNGISWMLTTPAVYLGTGNYLEFWHYCDSEAGSDGGNVQISINGGAWNLITPLGGYPGASVAALDAPGYSGSIGWSRARFDLSPYANRSASFRFTFASDASGQGLGWYIDDVSTFGLNTFAGLVSGHISINGASPDPANVRIGTQTGNMVIPDASLNYSIYLPAGQHTLTVSSDGYLTPAAVDVMIGLETSDWQQDFQLTELMPVRDFTAGHTEQAVQIHWQPPLQPVLPIAGYSMERRFDAGEFVPMPLGDDTSYMEPLLQPGRYQYRVIAVYAGGTSLPSPVYSVEYPFSPAPVTPPNPMVTRLYANYPNPFNPSTRITFDLAAPGMACLKVFNLRGQLVNTLCHRQLGAGTHSFAWDGMDGHGRRVASGIYLYRLEAPEYGSTRRMLMLK